MKIFRQGKLAALVATVVATGFAGTTSAHDMVPGKAQTQPILIANADLHTVSHGVQTNTDLLFQDGKILKIANDLDENPQQLPANTKIIQASGKQVYPGLLAMATHVGLVEVEAVRSTNDITEVSMTNPDLHAHVAFNADSEIIPTLRSNGITHVQVYPDGKLLMGQSSLLNMDAWNWQDALTQADTGLHINWPSIAVRKAWWITKTPEEQRKSTKKLHKKLTDFMQTAQAYFEAHKAGLTQKKDSRWDSMLPVFAGQKKVYVHADDRRDIQDSIRFFAAYNIKPVIVGGTDAWQIADYLAANDISVVYTAPYGIPERDGEAFDLGYKGASLLQQANVTTAIAINSSWSVRDLPFAAGMAVNFGLTQQQALHAVTLAPAKIMGVDDRLGSLDEGKSATLIISSGDILDFATHKIESLYIDGREVDLNNRHQQLYNKYSQH